MRIKENFADFISTESQRDSRNNAMLQYWYSKNLSEDLAEFTEAGYEVTKLGNNKYIAIESTRINQSLFIDEYDDYTNIIIIYG